MSAKGANAKNINKQGTVSGPCPKGEKAINIMYGCINSGIVGYSNPCFSKRVRFACFKYTVLQFLIHFFVCPKKEKN